MAISLTNAVASAMADAAVDLIDVGAGTQGKLEIRDGTQPANADAAATGVVLATFNLDATAAFGAASNGVATLAGTPLSTTGSATGTATWFRIYNSDTTPLAIMDGAVGTAGSVELTLNTTSISTGVNVEITSGTFTVPKA